MNDLIVDGPPAPALPTLHLGAPSQVGPLTLFPIWTDAPMPGAAMHVGLPEAAVIREFEPPSVERLEVDNPTDVPFVLFEGTMLDGGWQHRVLVHTTWIAAHATVQLDVRCIEHGRWRGDGVHRTHHRRAPSQIRASLHGTGLDREADQGEVWDRVQAFALTLGPSRTESLLDMTDRVEVPDELRSAMPSPLPGQRGVVAGLGGYPVLLEVFEHPDALDAQWEGLIEGLLATSLHLDPVPTPGRRARRFIARLSERPLQPLEATDDHQVRAGTNDEAVSISSLIVEGNLVHAAAINRRHELVGQP